MSPSDQPAPSRGVPWNHSARHLTCHSAVSPRALRRPNYAPTFPSPRGQAAPLTSPVPLNLSCPSRGPPCGCHHLRAAVTRACLPSFSLPTAVDLTTSPWSLPSSLTSLSGGTAVLGSQCPSRPRGPAGLPSSTPTLAPRPHSPEVLTAARTSGRAWRVSVCSWPQQHAGSLRPGERFRSEATPSLRTVPEGQRSQVHLLHSLLAGPRDHACQCAVGSPRSLGKGPSFCGRSATCVPTSRPVSPTSQGFCKLSAPPWGRCLCITSLFRGFLVWKAELFVSQSCFLPLRV